MDIAIVAAGIFGMLVLSVIVYGVWFESGNRSRKTRAFLVLVAGTFLAIGMNCAVYLPLDWADRSRLKFVLCLLNLATPFAVYALFLQYIFLHVSAKADISRKFFTIGVCYCGIGIASTLYYSFRGLLFTIENGRFIFGDYYQGYLLTYIVIILYTLSVVVANHARVGTHDTLASIMFMAIPVVFLTINMYFPACSFAIPSLALSMLVIHVMLQAEREQHLIANEVESSRLAHSDELTGLLNRLAYNELCDSMSGDGCVGVIFADVNGLKYTNDHFGHKAGDELLQEFADMLRGSFRKNEVFRISGDEFVAILRGIPRETFERKVRALIQKSDSRPIPLASVGFVYGVESDIGQLLDRAEKEMYVSKKRFHETHPL